MRLFERSNRFPPLFVIGAPRAGTTVVGLHAVAGFRCAYLPNVAKRHPRRPLAALRRALRTAPPWDVGYDSRHGLAAGPLAPSDGWDVLNRWFGPYTEAVAADARRARGFRTLVARLEELFGGPFFLKNDHNAMRVGALAALFPQASFVLVRRELPENVHSLLEARERHGIAPGKWWSAAPSRFLGRSFASELEQVVATVWGLERDVAARFAELDPACHTTLDYAAFCANPQLLTDWIARRYADLGVSLAARAGVPAAGFEPRRMEPAAREALAAEIAPIVARLESE